jgi:hypothetical protein
MVQSLVLMAAVCCAAPASVENADTQEHYDANIQPLVSGIEKAKRLVIYQGPPRDRADRDTVEKELKDKQKITLHGFQFYKETIASGDEGEKKIIALASDKKTFGKYGGPKFCGGFHPDWCLEFTSGREVYRVLICLGCHEARLYGPNKTSLFSDLDEDALKELLAVINPLAKRRAVVGP